MSEDHVPSTRRARLGAVTFGELTAGLIWPKLLRAFAMSVQLPRLFLGVLVGATCYGIGSLFDTVRGPIGEMRDQRLFATLLSGVTEPGIAGAGSSAVMNGQSWEFGAWLPRVPVQEALAAPLSLGVLLLLLLPVWAIGGGAISRMIAVDLAGDLNMSMDSALRFAGARWRSLMGAMLIPLIFMALLWVGLAVTGWVFFSLPVVRVLGGLFYGLMLVVGVVLAMIWIGFVLGQSMLIPAVATEGTDAMDAVQRAYAYVAGKPGRLLLYLVVLVMQAWIVIWFMRWFVGFVPDLTERAVTAMLSDEAASALTTDETTAGAIVEFWGNTFAYVLGGFAISFYFTASTILYMLLRQVNDGQDIREIWMPGMIDGTLAPEQAPWTTGGPDEGVPGLAPDDEPAVDDGGETGGRGKPDGAS